MQSKLMFLLNSKKILYISFLALLLNIGIVSNVAFAGMNLLKSNEVSQEEKDFKGTAGFSESTDSKTLTASVAQLIKIFLGILGVIFVILILTAGYKWFMAGGDSKQIDEAKDRMTRAVIGLTIIISAYTITYFVFSQLDTLGSIGDSSGSSSGSVTQPSSE